MSNITVGGQSFEVEYIEYLSELTFLDKFPPFLTFDTETTGLHLKKDKPFLAAVCAGHKVFVFPPTVDNLWTVRRWSMSVQRVYGHNVKYDCHMMANAGFDPLQIKNWGDTMALVRLAVEAISSREGGDSLGLKEVSKKYIDKDADKYEHAVKKWLTDKRRQDKKVLTALLKPLGWSASKFDKERESAIQDVLDVYENWRKSYPDPTYRDVPLDIMIPYLAVDVILTQLVVYKFLPVVVKREQVPVMQREFDLLPVVYKMERRGIKVDLDYLEKSYKALGDYITVSYERLQNLTGEEWSVGQHNEIKKYYTRILGKTPASTDKNFLKKRIAEGDEVAQIISRLRRLEKWEETYIARIAENASYDGRFYTQLNQFSPVSGRFSGDLQQMPKDPIYTEEGYEYEIEHPDDTVPDDFVLYHPRRAFITSEGVNTNSSGQFSLYFLDFSQVELRVQAHYTLYFGGDLNLCRAYMPFKCVHYQTGETYDYMTEEGKARWNELKPEFDEAKFRYEWYEIKKKNKPYEFADIADAGWSVWHHAEDNEPWHPTDVHTATTHRALRIMGHNPDEMDQKKVKWWRKKGKTFNFMRNYGGGANKAAETLEISLEQAQAMNQGYTSAFPVVITYQNAVIKTMKRRGYFENMGGRRYYLTDWNRHYKVANYAIQGSCADDLKDKMIKIDKFLTENNCESKMVLCIHDELVFEVLRGEDWIIPEVKRIMEHTPHINVPIVAEVEVTQTSWDKKYEPKEMSV